MSVKTTGFEFKRFYFDPEWWPDGTWHDEEEVTIDGKVADGETDLGEVSDNSIMVIQRGVVFSRTGKDLGSLEDHFKRWRKKQVTVSFVVEVHRDKEVAVREAIRAAGGKTK